MIGFKEERSLLNSSVFPSGKESMCFTSITIRPLNEIASEDRYREAGFCQTCQIFLGEIMLETGPFLENCRFFSLQLWPLV